MILPKTRLQIADEFHITTKTLLVWLKVHNIVLPKCLLTPKLQKIIYDAIGYPTGINKSDYENV